MLQSIKTIVFAGGGIRGLAFVGALQELRDKCGIDFGARTPKLDTVSGVSIGTLFALMVCLGYTIVELTEVASNLRQSDLINSDPLRILSGEYSIDDSSKLKEQIIKLLTRKGFSSETTLKELFEKTGMLFHCVVTDLTSASVVHIDAKSHPNLLILTAIVASMTLPLIYPPVEAPNGHLWVDGALMENFPMMRFDPKTLLGFNFKVTPEFTLDSMVTYITRVLYVQNVPLEVASWKLMSQEHRDRCIVIDAGKESTLALKDLSTEKRLILLQAGREAVKRKVYEWLGSPHDYLNDPHFGKAGLPTYLSSLETCSPEPRAHIS